MKRGILGKKIGMTHIWNSDSVQVPVTVVEAGPCYVVQSKEKGKDGYEAVQLGYGIAKEKHLNKSEMGHQKKLKEKIGNYVRTLFELRDFGGDKSVGDVIKCDIFKQGDSIFASGIAKGKGFQGVIKRHGFSGGPETHGSHFHRVTGSVGAGTDPGRVIKGQKMPGRMGGKKSTQKSVTVVDVKPDENIILLKGPIPGHNGTTVFLYQV